MPNHFRIGKSVPPAFVQRNYFAPLSRIQRQAFGHSSEFIQDFPRAWVRFITTIDE
jgi:hypothetical protein